MSQTTYTVLRPSQGDPDRHFEIARCVDGDIVAEVVRILLKTNDRNITRIIVEIARVDE